MNTKEMIERCEQLNNERIILNEKIFKAINAFLVDKYGEMVDENTPASEDVIGRVFAPEVSWYNTGDGCIAITFDVVDNKWIDRFTSKEAIISYDILDKYYGQE